MDRPAQAPPVADVSWYSRQVQQLADALFPGNAGAELRVVVGGREAVIPGVQPAGVGRSDMEQNILDALEEVGQATKVSGPELAKIAGYAYDSTFRGSLATLRKSGRIKNHSPGYSLPE